MEDIQEIKVRLEEPVTHVKIIITSIGKEEREIATDRIKLRLGRGYFIPVKPKTINSDEYKFIKILSKMAEQIDIRYIKNGYAYIIPLKYGVCLINDESLCAVW